MKPTALSVVVVCLSLQTVTAKPIPPSEVDESAVIYFYRGIALTNHPTSVFIDDDEVCSIRPQMFCVVKVRPGKHGVAQFSKNAYTQKEVSVEPGREYYFNFRPNNLLLIEDPGWKLVPPESGQKEIRGLRQEEIVVPPGVFPKGILGLGDAAHFETILVRLADRVEASFVYSYTNGSASDYVIQDGLTATLVEVKGWGEWSRNPDYRLNYPLIAPAGKKVLLTLSVNYDYAAPLKKGEEPTPQKLASFLKDRTSNLYSFFVFDPSNRMKVRFFAGWKPKADEVFGHFPQFFTHVGPKRRPCFSAIYATGPVGDSSKEAWKACLIGTNANIPSRPQENRSTPAT